MPARNHRPDLNMLFVTADETAIAAAPDAIADPAMRTRPFGRESLKTAVATMLDRPPARGRP